MFKKALLGAVSALVVSSAVFAANLPLQTFWDPTNGLGSINALIQSINGGVTGLLASSQGFTTSATTIQVALQTTIPGGALLPGQIVHIKAIGSNDSNADVRTVTFTFGTKTCAVIVTSTSHTWTTEFWLTVGATGASPTQVDSCNGEANGTWVATSESTSTVSTAAPVAVNVSLTAATAGTMSLTQGWIEVLR